MYIQITFDKDLVQTIVDETNCYAQQIRVPEATFSSKQCIAVAEICVVLALFMFIEIVQKRTRKLYVS
jgi:hypothetical protein